MGIYDIILFFNGNLQHAENIEAKSPLHAVKQFAPYITTPKSILYRLSRSCSCVPAVTVYSHTKNGGKRAFRFNISDPKYYALFIKHLK